MKQKIYNYYIDASTTRMGIVLEDEENRVLFITDLSFTKFKCNKNENHTKKQINKFRYISNKLNSFIEKWPTGDKIVLEGIFLNPTRRNSSEVLLKLHGFLMHKFLDKELIYIPPAHIKKAITGKGNASKEQVSNRIQKSNEHIHFYNNDQSDAFSIFLTHKTEEENCSILKIISEYEIYTIPGE